MGALVKDRDDLEDDVLSPTSDTTAVSQGSEDADEAKPTNLEDGDVADRAMSMLEGLKGEAGSDDEKGGQKAGGSREDSIRVRRSRRDSAQSEREQRRQRRRQLALSEAGGSRGENTIPEEPEPSPTKSERPERSSTEDYDDRAKGGAGKAPMPVTIVSPPSPRGDDDDEDSSD